MALPVARRASTIGFRPSPRSIGTSLGPFDTMLKGRRFVRGGAGPGWDRHHARHANFCLLAHVARRRPSRRHDRQRRPRGGDPGVASPNFGQGDLVIRRRRLVPQPACSWGKSTRSRSGSLPSSSARESLFSQASTESRRLDSLRPAAIPRASSC